MTTEADIKPDPLNESKTIMSSIDIPSVTTNSNNTISNNTISNNTNSNKVLYATTAIYHGIGGSKKKNKSKKKKINQRKKKFPSLNKNKNKNKNTQKNIYYVWKFLKSNTRKLISKLKKKYKIYNIDKC